MLNSSKIAYFFHSSGMNSGILKTSLKKMLYSDLVFGHS